MSEGSSAVARRCAHCLKTTPELTPGSLLNCQFCSQPLGSGKPLLQRLGSENSKEPMQQPTTDNSLPQKQEPDQNSPEGSSVFEPRTHPPKFPPSHPSIAHPSSVVTSPSGSKLHDDYDHPDGQRRTSESDEERSPTKLTQHEGNKEDSKEPVKAAGSGTPPSAMLMGDSHKGSATYPFLTSPNQVSSYYWSPS